MARAEESTQDVLQGHLQLLNHTLGYIKSAALTVALDLGIADAIHHHGGSATLSQILARIGADPAKPRGLRRLMRMLTVSGIFGLHRRPAASPSPDGCGEAAEAVYQLTPASRLLLGGGGGSEGSSSRTTTTPSLTPFLTVLLAPLLASPLATVASAVVREEVQPGLAAFGIAHGETVWDGPEGAFDFSLHDAFAADTRVLMPVVVRECRDVFQGIDSLVDVGGGLYGAAAAAIAAAFPYIKCSVLDLPHVVAQAPANSSVQFISGDMFQGVPPADAILLKWILHDWGDDDCVKLLKRCKEAIPAGGKVIIIDMVLGSGPSDDKHRETQVLFDLMMLVINGVERDEEEWRKIIFAAGFEDYKITPVLGVRSIIELYPMKAPRTRL